MKYLKFTSGVIKLTGSSLVITIVNVIMTPFIIRIYNVEIIGVVALIVSIGSFIGSLSCFFYDISIMISETKEKAANLSAASLCFVLITMVLSIALIFFFGRHILRIFNIANLKGYIWFIPFIAAIDGILLVFLMWNSRNSRFGHLGICVVVSCFISNILKLLFAYLGYISILAFMAGEIIGKIASIFIQLKHILRNDKDILTKSISRREMFLGIIRYNKLFVFTSWSLLIQKINLKLPLWILGSLFNSTIVGYYAICRMVLNAPFSFVGWGFSQVFFQQASEFNKKGELPNLVETAYKRITGFTVLPFFVLLFMGKDIFSVLLGDRFGDAGFYVQVLSLEAFFSFAFWPLSRLLGVKEKYLRGLIINLVLLLSSLSLLLMGYLTRDAMLAITIFGIISALAYLFSSLWLLSLVGIYSRVALAYLARGILRYLPILALIGLVKWKIGIKDMGTLLTLLFISSSYYFVTIIQDKSLFLAARKSFLNIGSGMRRAKHKYRV